MSGNILFIVLDQLRADCVFGKLAQYVPTPNLDNFRAQSTSFLNHYTVTAPCGPARASLLTGLYAGSHGVRRNGDPLSHKITNIALETRKLGYEPLLFGYTDSMPDPETHHRNDPVLRSYEGVMPGFREIVEMRFEDGFEWPAYLRSKGYPIDLPVDRAALYRPQNGKLGGEAMYRAEDSDTAYLTNETIKQLGIRQGHGAWFAHVTYIRPHPPLVAPAPYNTLIDPLTLPEPIPREAAPNHPFFDAWFSEPGNFGLYHGYDGRADAITGDVAQLLRATYLGLLAEVDDHLGRLLDWLDQSGQAGETLVIVTADHAEMLGDYGMWGKASILPQAYHVPLMIRLPEQPPGRPVEDFSESIDLAPTILEWAGGGVQPTFQGSSLMPWLRGDTPSSWRGSAFMEAKFGNESPVNRFDRHFPSLEAEMYQHKEERRITFKGRLPELVLSG